jgi:hypothetical protein
MVKLAAKGDAGRVGDAGGAPYPIAGATRSPHLLGPVRPAKAASSAADSAADESRGMLAGRQRAREKMRRPPVESVSRRSKGAKTIPEKRPSRRVQPS